MSVDNNIAKETTENALDKGAEPIYRATFWNVYFLGLGMKLGGFAISWNYGLQSGFRDYLGAVVGIGIAYTMLALCMAEMVSIMSFSGGYYGYARCALGPTYGFLVGCSGAMESTFYLAMYVLKIGQFIMICFGADFHHQPWIWALTYLFLFSFHVLFSNYFWNLTFLLSICSLVLLLIYISGSIPQMNLNYYAMHDPDSSSTGQDEFLSVFRLAVLFFLGFDMITLTSNDVKEPKKCIPMVLLCLVGTLFVLAIITVICVASQYPGVTLELYQTNTYFPLVFGYEAIFQINHTQATFISVIPVLVTALGYLHIVARQLKSMATSGLLPPWLKYTYGKDELPIVAMFVVGILAYLANLFAWTEGMATTSSRISTMAACFVYVSMFYCYIIFNKRYGHLDRGFHNPLGIYSAILGMAFFITMFFLIFFIKIHDYWNISILYFIYMAVMLFYYYSYAESRQCFSISEQKVFFKAYILNMQIRKKKAIHHRFAADLTSILTLGLLTSSARSKPNSTSQLNNLTSQTVQPSTDTNRNNKHTNKYLTSQSNLHNSNSIHNSNNTSSRSSSISLFNQISKHIFSMYRSSIDEVVPITTNKEKASEDNIFDEHIHSIEKLKIEESLNLKQTQSNEAKNDSSLLQPLDDLVDNLQDQENHENAIIEKIIQLQSDPLMKLD